MRPEVGLPDDGEESPMRFERNLPHGATCFDWHVPCSRRNLNANENEVKRHETTYFDRVSIVHVHGRDRVRLRGE